LKRSVSVILTLALCASLAGCGQTGDPAVSAPAASGPEASTLAASTPAASAAFPEPTQEELQKALDLGLPLSHDLADPDGPISFQEYKAILDKLVALCDPEAVSAWEASVDTKAFPKRDPRRDDGLNLLLMAARALGYDIYNARDYIICTEYQVNYDQMYEQFSWDYPYADMEEEWSLYSAPGVWDEPPIGKLPEAGIYWMQRRMDLSQWKHFLDHDGALDFHLDQPLTWKAAAAAALRLYNSEKLDILDYKPVPREPTEADKAMLAKAEARKQEILDSMGGLECTGTAYYVSNSGSDRNSGRSPNAAWATLDRVNEAQLRPGDGVYFQRGGLWRGRLYAQDGVTYSAYGEGEKPRLYGSPENGAGAEKWTLLEGTDNIWVYHIPLPDCGGVVFNEGECYGSKACPYYIDGFRSPDDPSKPFDVKTELTEDLDFFSQANSILYNGAPLRFNTDENTKIEHWRYEDIPDVVGELYLRCDEGNPGEVFDSIEFAANPYPDRNLAFAADGAVFDNLCIRYSGGFAIYGYDADFEVTNCEIGWIGGGIQYYYYDTGAPIRFGNGVEGGGCFDRFSVTDCYLYHCWDAGVTNQDSADEPNMTGADTLQYEDAIHRNITYARNVIEYTAMPVEIFFNLDDDAGYGRHYMENVLVADNYMLYTGYGWSTTDPVNSVLTNHACYMGHQSPNTAVNFRMENNVFYLSTGPLLYTWAKQDSLPVLNGNTYAQSEGSPLAGWTSEEEKGTTYWYHEDTALDIIQNVLGDKTGKLLN